MTLTRGFVRNAVTTPLDARLMDMAKVVCNNDGSPRVGLLGSAGATAVATTGSTGPMTVNVLANEYVVSKGKADGVVILTNDGTVAVPITAAPGANSRITSIWVKHNDDTTGDANALPIFGTTDGVAAASPVAPAIPTGALELAQLRVYAGTTASNGGSNTLTQRAPMTCMRGGTVMARAFSELAAWTNAVDGQRAWVIGEGAERAEYVSKAGVFKRAPMVDGALVSTATTDASGNILVPHNLGIVPDEVQVTDRVGSGGTAVSTRVLRITSVSATDFGIRYYNGGAALASGTVSFMWHATKFG